jgi:hypothetical protein
MVMTVQIVDCQFNAYHEISNPSHVEIIGELRNATI